jgi:4-hydroxy-2-oxoglutarate aldolase
MLLEGIFLPLTTPFHADGRLFLSKLEYNVERYSRTPAAGLLVLGSAGEPDALTHDEARAVLNSAAQAAADEKVLIASVARESVFATLQLAETATSAGYDAVAVRGPAFTEDSSLAIELMTYFRAVADASALPVVLLSEPGRLLSVETVGELAQHPNILGILNAEATANWIASVKTATAGVTREVTVTSVFAAATRRMLRVPVTSLANLGGVAVLDARPTLRTRMKRVGFQILTGSTATMLEAWQAGANGAVPRLGPCAPQACCEVWQAFRDGDLPLAEEKQHRVRAVAPLVEGLAGIGATKHGCDFNGYFGGRPRLPLLGLTAAQAADLERDLAGMRN